MDNPQPQPNLSLTTLLPQLEAKLPDVEFIPDDNFRWNPAEQRLHYIADDTHYGSLVMLLHETGHALAKHQFFSNDIDLLRKEVEAWTHARQLAHELEIEIDETIVENCLDSYRHWLDKRSTCPDCSATGYQDNDCAYRCFNCASRWRVSTDQTTRVCRVTA